MLYRSEDIRKNHSRNGTIEWDCCLALPKGCVAAAAAATAAATEEGTEGIPEFPEDGDIGGCQNWK